MERENWKERVLERHCDENDENDEEKESAVLILLVYYPLLLAL